MRIQQRLFLPAVAIVAALASSPAWAQSGDASLSGVVRDVAKNPVAGATVTATNTTTKESVTATTAADGSWRLVVPPGTYSVKTTIAGFWGPELPIDVAAGVSDRSTSRSFRCSTRS